MKRRRKVLAAGMLIPVILALLVCWELYASLHSLQVERYQVSAPQLTGALRLVVLADLHNNSFGEDNRELVGAVQEEQPDLILIPGDIPDRSSPDTDTALSLIRQLSAICPVYVSLGNHEVSWQETWGEDISALYREAGAHVLEFDREDITVKGQELRVAGLYGYCVSSRWLKTGEADPQECAFLDDCVDCDRYRILLCHMPVCWHQGSLETWDMDLVVAGHAHGGSVILPWVGALYGPDYGWFPGRLKGMFHSKDGSRHLFLSPGLGTSGRRPRFNNRPEVSVIDLLPS